MRKIFSFFRKNTSENSENTTTLLNPSESHQTEINDAPITIAYKEKSKFLKDDSEVNNTILTNEIIATLFLPKENPLEKENKDFIERWCILGVQAIVEDALDASDDDSTEDKKKKMENVIEQLTRIIQEDNSSKKINIKWLAWLGAYLACTLTTTTCIIFNTQPKDWGAEDGNIYSSSSGSSEFTAGEVLAITILPAVIWALLILLLKIQCANNCKNTASITQLEHNDFTKFLTDKKVINNDARKAAIFMTLQAHLESLQEKYAMLLNSVHIEEREQTLTIN